MIDIPIPVLILQPKQIAVNKHHEHVQLYHLRFETEFTDDVAAGLSPFAAELRRALVAGESRGGTIAIDALVCSLELKDCPRAIKLEEAQGVRTRASIRIASKEDEEVTPRLSFAFECEWTDGLVVSMAHNVGQEGKLLLRRKQVKLPGIK